MHDNRGLRILSYLFKTLSGLVLLATILVVLAIVGGGNIPPPGIAGTYLWTVTLGGAAIVTLSGFIVALLLFALSEAIGVLLALAKHLKEAAAAANGERE